MPSSSLLFGKSATYSAKRFPQRMNLPHIMDSVFLWTGFRQPIAETESI